MARRILDEVTGSTYNSDDYLYIDGVTEGARKITPDNVVRGTSVAQQLAQHIADAEDEVEQITEDIEGIQSDINDVKGDIGDLEDLETEDKSSLVNAINEARGSGGSGLTEDVKVALLQIAEHVAYTDAHGQEYYDELYDALYPPADLVSISAVYTQGGTVYDNQTLDSLKTDLVVTAHMSDSTTQTVTTYTLSGTLATGTSTITVAYGGKTTTFTVTVTHAVTQYTITNNLTHCTNSNSATVINEETAYSGTITASSGYIMSTATITMSGTDITSTAYDSSTGAISIASVTGNIVITAEAVEDVGWVSGVPYDIEWSSGTIDNSTGAVTENASYTVSGFLPCNGVSAFDMTNMYANGSRVIYYYDENQNFIYAFYKTAALHPPCPAPRHARYARVVHRNSDGTGSLTPYLYPTLGENTAWVANQKYVLSYSGDNSADGSGNTTSDYAFCYGASTLQCAMFARSFIYFYDAEKTQLSSATRQGNADAITVPEGAYYFKISPGQGSLKYDYNTNNPWVYLA